MALRPWGWRRDTSTFLAVAPHVTGRVWQMAKNPHCTAHVFLKDETMARCLNRAEKFISGGEQDFRRRFRRNLSAPRHFGRAADLFPALRV
jgi:hypothetical protein